MYNTTQVILFSSYCIAITSVLRENSSFFRHVLDSDGRLEDAEDIRTRSKITFLSRLPVDYIPDILHICGLAVLVLEVVGVLPL